MAALYDDVQVAAEIPEAIARVEVALDRDDPRRVAALGLPGRGCLRIPQPGNGS